MPGVLLCGSMKWTSPTSRRAYCQACEPSNIYTAVVLPPGNTKSAVFKPCAEPLVQWENIAEYWSFQKKALAAVDSFRAAGKEVTP
jgi:Protein of unknown function (DUF3987)